MVIVHQRERRRDLVALHDRAHLPVNIHHPVRVLHDLDALHTHQPVGKDIPDDPHGAEHVAGEPVDGPQRIPQLLVIKPVTDRIDEIGNHTSTQCQSVVDAHSRQRPPCGAVSTLNADADPDLQIACKRSTSDGHGL